MSENIVKMVGTTLTQANAITVLTGAGVSAESGIPTFRDKQTGLWENFRAEELASQAGFQANPELVWQWYQMRRRSFKDKQPNPAHTAIFKLEQFCKKHGKVFTLVSQNVDNLHEQAGSMPLKIHGSIMMNHCNACGRAFSENFLESDELLYCSVCSGIVRPSVVWFGETLPEQTWYEAHEAAKKCDVFISIGTSSMVYPAAGLIDLAKDNHAIVIEINPNPTHNPRVDMQIAEKAGLVLPKVVDCLI